MLCISVGTPRQSIASSVGVRESSVEGSGKKEGAGTGVLGVRAQLEAGGTAGRGTVTALSQTRSLRTKHSDVIGPAAGV